MKKWIAMLLCAALLITPLTGITFVSAASATYAVEALDFSAGYASTEDGTLDLTAVKKYDAYEQYNLKYLDENTALSSASGIPYQVFDVALGGKTSGTVAVHYSGSTKAGERIALRAYNVQSKSWDTLGSFKGTGEVSADVNVATYNDGGVIHVAAVLDYVTNGANTMIWSTDPQHYTKFEDLHEFYYTIYQYAAEQYVAGNVGYIFTTGDLVDDLPTASIAPYQWKVADRAMKYVEAVGMPNGLVSGNHDVGTLNATDYTTTAPNADYSRFWETFPASRYENERWYGGSLNNNASHYDLITVGNVDFIVLFLGYGVEATDETIAWANDVLKTYSHRTAIVATHQYLEALDATYKNRGKLIYDTIVDPNPNVKMVACGHDDGSLCLEKTASDGRTVYELLADYQFVEAEDPDFYANEHWIGKVSSCCGDGYIRLMTVEGDTLSSITYSPVTGRFNPYGDVENVSIDLDCGTPDRTMATSRFSAAVVGAATTATDVDRITKTGGAYSAVTYATVPAAPAATDPTAWPQVTYGEAATPSNPYLTHAAKEGPTVAFKVDVLEAAKLGAHPTLTGNVMNFGNNAMKLKVDLNRTPYLYYSFAVPEGAAATFAFINDTTNAPWLTFADVAKGGATMNNGSSTWDACAGSQYFTQSVTGCIDMRTLTKTADATEWIVQQLNFYNRTNANVVLSYMYFGSAPIDTIGTVFGDAATPADPEAPHAAKKAPVVEHKVDVLKAVHLNDNAIIYEWVTYGSNSLGLEIDLEKTPYLYYSFSQAANSNFTFSFFNENSNNPWLTFLDATQGGATMNNGNDNWESYNGNARQYFTGSMTGCIDMRQFLYDKNKQDWTVNQVSFYNLNRVPVMVNYMFFGSAAPGGDDQVSADAAALDALLAKADATSTDGMVSSTVTALNQAKNVARYVDRTDVNATANAYFELAEALGGLKRPVAADADASKLTSLCVYSLSPSSWVCNDTRGSISSSNYIVGEATSAGGLRIKRSPNCTHTWPGILYTGSNASYSVTPHGGLYLNLDMVAKTGWTINLIVNQYGYSQTIHLAPGITNSFHNHLADGYAGVYKGAYDVTEAFESYGFDATAPFTVTGMYVLSVGGNSDWNTFNRIELMTGSSSSASYYELEETIARATGLTQSMYTAASWSTFSSALSQANTAMSTTGLSQAKINLAQTRLENALEALVLTTYKEASGSVLPDDIGAWIPSNTNAVRSGNSTVITNTNGTWAQATYLFSDDRRVRTDKYQLEVDMTVADAANILLLVDGEWYSVSSAITTNLNGEDMLAGTYKLKIPMSKIVGFAGKDAAVLEGIRVWSVGAVGNNAVTLRKFKITPYCTHVPDYTVGAFGAAATQAGTAAARAAEHGPNVAKKVDVLAACGLDHPTIGAYATYGDNKMHLTVDLNKTPYLYYSIIQPAGSKCTFGFYSDNTNAPWFTFLDANLGGGTLNKDVANWDAYTGASQYFSGSVTGCVDMRTLLKDSSATEWLLNGVTFYKAGTDTATISYLYFGSAPIDDGYEEPSYKAGDVNFDGVITSKDARAVLLYVLGKTDEPFTPVQQAAANYNGDAVLNTSDVRLILKASLM